jgi:hypothetical protein
MAMARMNSIREERPGGASGRRPFRHASALVLLIAAAAAGWFAADRLLTEVSVMVVSTDHGPMPTLRSGETVVVQVETSADKFVYCYYMDGSRQVARIFPNRFQSDAFVPAGQTVQIPPGPESERPFNIRLDNAGRMEVITCLASPTAVDRGQIDGTEIEDLTPIPGLRLLDLFNAFGKLSATGASSQTMPINVVAGADEQPPRPNRSWPIRFDVIDSRVVND